MTCFDLTRKRWLVLLGAALLCTLAGPSLAQDKTDCPAPLREIDEAQLQAAQTNARDRGLLWRIARDGHVSHLYGSLHIGRIEWLMPGPRLREALRESNALAIEIDIIDPEVASAFMAALPDAPTLSASTRSQVEEAAQRDCVDASAVAGLPPLLQAATLELAAARRDGLESALAQDLVLRGMAMAAGLPVHSLEDAQTQAAALTPPNSADGERWLRRSLQDLRNGRARPVMLRMAAAWERGDLDDIAAYPSWCRCIDNASDRDFYRHLNDDRNANLADRIAALHGEGLHLFAAVGALHMTGAQALPALLARRGFTVERVSFAP